VIELQSDGVERRSNRSRITVVVIKSAQRDANTARWL